MSVRSLVLALCAATPLLAGVAGAASLVSMPLSHPLGLQSATCHLVNGGTKPITVTYFWVDDVDVSSSLGNTSVGCTGPGPWTIQPGTGCSRQLNSVTSCSQPDGCFCKAEVSGSLAGVRGSFIATVNSSSAVLMSDLKAK